MTVWQEKLDAGEIVILDGAIGSELEKRGVVMDDDAWCGRAMLSDPDVVRTLHDDYIAAGADVITTNTFGTNRFALEPAGLNDRFDEINQLAVDLARQARPTARLRSPVRFRRCRRWHIWTICRHRPGRPMTTGGWLIDWHKPAVTSFSAK